MVAEEIFFGESSTGPGGDLATATTLAAQMVGAFGMTGSLVSYEAVEPGPLANGIVGKVLSFDAGRLSVEDLLARSRDEVRDLLTAHGHLVAALRDELLVREELVGDEILAVLRAAAVVDLRAGGDGALQVPFRPAEAVPQVSSRSSAWGRHGTGPSGTRE